MEGFLFFGPLELKSSSASGRCNELFNGALPPDTNAIPDNKMH